MMDLKHILKNNSKIIILILMFLKIISTVFLDVFIQHLKSVNWHDYQLPPSANFPCTPGQKSNPKPTSAKKLKPQDVDVVMAIGDSITAAFGADSKSIFTVFTEYRGLSFSIGGDKFYNASVITLANILREFNPKVQGFSIGKGGATTDNARLNQAVSGAVSSAMLGQAQTIYNKLKQGETQGKWSFANDWKVLSIFIGGNDLCDFCDDESRFSPANYKKNLESALDYLQQNIPRLYVNLVSPVDITKLGVLSTGFCALLHPFECSCAVGSGVPRTKQAWKEFLTAIDEIGALQKYKNKEDFGLFVQPFYIDTDVPYVNGKPDTSYFAPDCFHFSTKAHVASAVALWNNMLEVSGAKARSWVLGESIKCPKTDQYLS